MTRELPNVNDDESVLRISQGLLLRKETHEGWPVRCRHMHDQLRYPIYILTDFSRCTTALRPFAFPGKVLDGSGDLITYDEIHDGPAYAVSAQISSGRKSGAGDFHFSAHVPRGTGNQAGSIRLKNLMRQAEQQLINEGTRAAEARTLLEPVASLVEDSAFWRHQAEGLAVFRSPDVFRSYRMPFAVTEFVAVSDRFYIKPLLPLLINEAHFYVLALSQKAVRLLDCTRDGLEPVSLPEMPEGIEQTLPEADGPAPYLQRYSLPMGGPEGGRVHGHGAGTEDVDVIKVKRYFHWVEEVLHQRLTNERVPLILACVEYLVPIWCRSIEK